MSSVLSDDPNTNWNPSAIPTTPAIPVESTPRTYELSDNSPVYDFTSNIASTFEFPSHLQSSYSQIPEDGLRLCDQIDRVYAEFGAYDEIPDALAYDLGFPLVFRAYLALLREHKRDFETDHYFQAIRHVIADIIETGVSMAAWVRLTAYSGLLTNPEPSPTTTLLMREAIFRFSSESAFLTSSFERWNRRRKDVARLDDLCRIHIHQNTRRVFKLWFHRTLKVHALKKQAALLNHTYTTFRYWQCWRTRAGERVTREARATQFIAHKAFYAWKHRADAIHALETKATEHRDTQLKKKATELLKLPLQSGPLRNIHDRILMTVFLDLWEDRLRRVAQANLQAGKIYATASVAQLMAKWEARTGHTLAVLQELHVRERSFVLQRYMGVWKIQHRLLSTEACATANTDTILLAWMFRRWQKRCTERTLLQDAQDDRDARTMASCLGTWRKAAVMEAAARKLRAKRLLSGAFACWRLQSRAFELEITQGSALLENTFRNWKLATVALLHEQSREYNLSKRYIRLWAEKVQRIAALDDSIDARFDLISTVRACFSTWKRGLRTIRAMRAEVDDILCAKVFQMLRYRIQLNRQNAEQAETFHRQSVVAKKIAFRRWNEAYTDRYELRAQGLVAQFHARMRVRSVAEHFEIWRERVAEQRVLEERCLHFAAARTIPPAWDAWMDRLQANIDFRETAAQAYTQSLLRRSLTAFREQYSRLQRLAARELDFEAERDVRLMQQYSDIWSVNVLRARRNEESAKFFRQRWEQAKLRMFIKIWRDNLRVKMEGGPDESFSVSDVSPLASKRRTSKMLEYNRRPLEQPLFGGNETPSTNLSPSKLAETTERIKRERMNALKQRYSRARDAVSPEKAPGTLEQPLRNLFSAVPSTDNRIPPLNVSLSPRRRGRTTWSPLLFPATGDRSVETVNFNGSSSPQRVALSRISKQDNSLPFNIPPPVYQNEEPWESATVETAKKLNRITPIFIPTNGIGLPKISPAPIIQQRSNSYIERAIRPESRTTITDLSMSEFPE
ncbi:hypothetical protein BABINDRAFT_163277 [Babjeviella inositovora NRRL Y-12698]|uniref:Sfi1 spindle body domain-containing protein n=1 Tax=Babjeviella inositovora NRRL Y-12698 TaxID=984486 RepID=A0A1E3QLP3_9ASCO|nr:uncharacterized protein BABINDRAFT_163277 [Babjeviella inositovora NRRL Y-12698]ODQ77907.1 hypothetical protein BABINDRAFT_163277 [Babjeviella inositovora NRRL Y-12698]